MTIVATPRRLAISALLCSVIGTGAVAAQSIPLVRDVPLPPGVSLAVKLRAGTVVVDAAEPSETLGVSARANCAKADAAQCAELQESLSLTTSASGDRLEIGIDQPLRHFGSVSLHLLLPPGHALEIDLGAGEVHLTGLRDPIEIDVGAGDIEADLDLDRFVSIDLDSRAGRAILELPDGKIIGSGLVGSSLEWTREGQGGVARSRRRRRRDPGQLALESPARVAPTLGRGVPRLPTPAPP